MSISGSRKSAVLENGVLRITEFSEDTDSYRQRAACNTREELDAKTETIEFEGVRDRELYIRMLQNFTNAVLSGETPVAPGSEGAGALALTEGDYKSEDRGVRISELFKEDEK